jgi:hypothetical protein
MCNDKRFSTLQHHQDWMGGTVFLVNLDWTGFLAETDWTVCLEWTVRRA